VNFFNMGPGEMIMILIIALIVFGPGKLPEIGASVGRGIREFRRATSDITSEITREIEEVKSTTDSVTETFKREANILEVHQPREAKETASPVAAPASEPTPVIKPATTTLIRQADLAPAAAEPVAEAVVTESAAPVAAEHEQGGEAAIAEDVAPAATAEAELAEAVSEEAKTEA
jgi:TatA/E family protein of Tat protein translocase